MLAPSSPQYVRCATNDVLAVEHFDHSHVDYIVEKINATNLTAAEHEGRARRSQPGEFDQSSHKHSRLLAYGSFERDAKGVLVAMNSDSLAESRKIPFLNEVSRSMRSVTTRARLYSSQRVQRFNPHLGELVGP